MNINRREFIKLSAFSALFPKEVLGEINNSKGEVLKVISFNTQRNERFEKLIEDLEFMLYKLLEKENNFIMGLQEVSDEVCLFLSNFCSKNNLSVYKIGENLTILKGFSNISQKELKLPGNRIIQQIDEKNFSFFNGDFQHGISFKQVDLRNKQLKYFVDLLKGLDKCIITVDTNLIFPEEIIEFKNELVQSGLNYTDLGRTFNPENLEDFSLLHFLGRKYCEFFGKQLELDRILFKGFSVVDMGKMDNINSSDHTPIYVSIN